MKPSEQDKQQRESYWQEVANKAAEKFVFIDETSAYVGINREYAWAPRDARAEDEQPKGKKERVSLIAACSLKASMAQQGLVVEGSIDKSTFLGYLEYCLLPELERGSILVLDNWAVHHGEEVRELVEAAGCELCYLPTYSPDFNPIEHLFSKVKAFIKKVRPDCINNLVQAFCKAVQSITPENVFNSIEHCGYSMGV